MRVVVTIVALGFPVALVLSWAFEITPDGVKWTQDVAPARSITHRTGRKLAGISVVLAMLAVGLFLFQSIRRPAVTDESGRKGVVAFQPVPEKSIAVLPFENLSEEKANAFFTDGVQDEILTDLAMIADLKVISRTSVMQYKSGVARNLREIGRQLGVAHILEGSVQRIGDHVRVNAQLIDARIDAHLWAQIYDRNLSDIFAIQSEIAAAIARELKAKLSPTEKVAVEKPPTADLAAYDLYLRAKGLLSSTSYDARSKDDILEATQLLDRAVTRDPSFLLAYCRLANAHDLLYFFSFDHTAARLAKAGAAVQSALHLAPDSGEAHLARAGDLYRGYLDYDGARAELSLASRTLPNDSRIFALTGYIDRRQGRWDEALRNLKSALDLDPRNFLLFDQISGIYDRSRRYPEAITDLDQALSIAPKDLGTRVSRAYIDLERQANTRPLHALIESILADNPAAAGNVANKWLELSLCERDPSAAARALVALGENSAGSDAVLLSRHCWEGLVGRMTRDETKARAAFMTARVEQAKVVQAQPDYAPAICVLGLIDAGLGRKEDALREGKEAVTLLPVARDSVNGPLLIQYLAVIAAWTGDKDLAFEELNVSRQLPGGVSYGQVKLHPFWDPLRDDPRFNQIVAALAPPES
jgi:serine/threonine-protein kinase